MVLKTNNATAEITEDDLIHHMEAVFTSMTASRLSAATALAHLYQLHVHTRTGMGRKWLSDQADSYESMVAENNLAIDARFQEADAFMDGKLAADHDVNKKAETPEEKANQEKLKEQLRADAKISKEDRRKLRYVSLKGRENSNDNVKLVRISMHLYHSSQSAHVSRNCYALEWLNRHYKDQPIPSLDAVKDLIERSGGFEAIIERERLAEQNSDHATEVRAIGKAAIRAAAREKVRTMPAITRFEMPIMNTKDGFANILVRVDGKFVEVISEADAPEVEIESTVNRVGSALQMDADPKCEMTGRLLEFARLVPFGQTIMSEDGKNKLGESQQFITIRPGADSTPELVVSSSCVEAGPVLIARPHDQELMGLRDQYASVRGGDRKKLEMAFGDPAQRSIRSLSADLEPNKADGRPAKALMSWVCENIAVKEANEKRVKDKKPPLSAIEQVYWDDFNNVSHKPLDIDGFAPQLTGSLVSGDIAEILSLFPKPGHQSKAGQDGGDTTKKLKTPRSVEFSFAEDQLTVTYGDADPITLDCKTGSKSVVTVRLRMLDVMGLFTLLNDKDCQKVELEPDDRGLVKFGWNDSYASYAMHFPTCSADAKLHSKRLATMRAELPAMVQAAE